MIAIMVIWVVGAVLALTFFGRVVWLERDNPRTGITYFGVLFGVMVSLFPAVGYVVVAFCIVEFPQHFKLINQSVYRGH